MPLNRKRWKRQLSLLLIYSPFLRLVLFNKWFRAAILLILAGILFLALYLPKIWTLSPDGFLPVVKASGLDLTQARILKKSAAEAEARRDFDHANYCWQSAIVRNAADAHAIRGFLKNVLNLPDPDRRTVGVAYNQSIWLLRLEKTNSLDAELCIRIYNHFRWPDLVVQNFSGRAEDLTPAGRAGYLKALFNTGRAAEFITELENSPDLDDPELPLYRAAWLAGWSEDISSTAALHSLRGLATDETQINRLAIRLYMMVSARRSDLEGYAASLDRLARMNEATVLDHIGYWRLLLNAGRESEAVALARGFSRPPGTPIETVQLARICHALELPDLSLEILRQHTSAFYFSAEVWATYANLLEDTRDWQAMRAIALQMRRHPGTEGFLDGFSHLLEGRSELAQQRLAPAETAFRKAAAAHYDNAAVGFMIARELAKLDHHDLARTVLHKIRPEYEDRLDYWQAAFDSAFALRDGPWLLESARHVYEMQPHEIQAINRYAASLMVNRAEPEEAIRLTLQMTGAYPDSPAAVINHAFALLLNRRFEEARHWLGRIRPAALDPIQSSAYHLALFELHLHSKSYDDAWRASDKIFATQLFPAQRDWLEQSKTQMPPRLTTL